MSKRNLSLTSAQGAESDITATNFFANGFADPTAFLDSFEPLSTTGRRKYAKLWEGLKKGRTILGVLNELIDDNDIHYTWVEMETPRGKILFRVVLFTPQMFELLNEYQDGRATFRCTLQELLEEAERLENESLSKAAL